MIKDPKIPSGFPVSSTLAATNFISQLKKPKLKIINPRFDEVICYEN